MTSGPGQRLGAEAARRLAARDGVQVTLPPGVIGLAGYVELHPPLTEAEIDRLQETFAFEFADDHRAFLAAGTGPTTATVNAMTRAAIQGKALFWAGLVEFFFILMSAAMIVNYRRAARARWTAMRMWACVFRSRGRSREAWQVAGRIAIRSIPIYVLSMPPFAPGYSRQPGAGGESLWRSLAAPGFSLCSC